MRAAQRLLGAKHKRFGIAAGIAIAAITLGVVAIPSPALATPTTTAYAATRPASPSLSTLEQQIKEQSAALEKIIEQYDGVSEQLKANQQKEVKLTAALVPLSTKLDAARDSVSQIVSQAYMTGPVDSLTTLVNSSSTSDMLDQMAAMNQMAASQAEDIKQYAAVQAEYNAQKQQLDGLIAVQKSQQADLAKQKTTINTKLKALYKLRTEAYGRATEQSSSSTTSAPTYLSGRGGAVVKFAYAQLGKPYEWAADGPDSYDCSGLTLAAYKTVGVTLYHKVSVQWTEVHHITRSQLMPGDLVFYESLGHVAIYIGDSKVIHAPQPGEVVKISSVDMMTPYGYGRP